ncbi:DUF3667 domain-containing protein [Phaeocystidibacter luteus]|uniref:DUF3667 domain-containing protein n=1 Tax=Phaeocystidibacter luteus TaxID=911197 RepID=A0A6N6RG31_9FLAO|nr:DUF3667 domain-containing protein [Phaeocystidibacter luteus]KAB2807329.1 DUF3667 domain-containing protein [Phaeocystidibacter luteus]
MRRKIEKTDHCLNCGTETGDANFCPNCGQLNNAHKPNIWELIRDAVENLFAFDSRFYRSLGPLLWRPGKLTRHFNEGKRATYVLPIRLFILMTIFLIAASSCDDRMEKEHWYEVERPDKADAPGDLTTFGGDTLNMFIEDTTDYPKNVLDSLKATKMIRWDSEQEKYVYRQAPGDLVDFELGEGIFSRYMDYAKDHPYTPVDSALIEMGEEHTFWNLLVYSNMLKISLMTGDEFVSYLGRNILIILLLFIPCIALTLKVLYIYKSIYYVDHFVFAIHVQTALFAYAVLAIMIHWIFPYDIISTIYSLGMALYVFLAMLRYYKQGVGLTILKFILMNSALFIVSIIFILLVASVSVLIY